MDIINTKLLPAFLTASLLISVQSVFASGDQGIIGIGTLGFPTATAVNSTSGGTSYTSGTLTISATPLKIVFTSGGCSELFTPDSSLDITAEIDAAGNLNSGTSTFSLTGTVTDTMCDNDSLNDFTYTGTLLSGTVSEYGISDVGGVGGTDLMDMLVQPDAGSDPDFSLPFSGGTGLVGLAFTLEGSSYSGDFSSDWSVGKTKVVIGPELAPEPGPGTGTPGYWKNHPEAWPTAFIEIGGQYYSISKAIDIIKTPVKRDKTRTLFRAIVSAKLNILIGNGDCNGLVSDIIADGDAWLAENGVNTGIKTSSDNWDIGEPIYEFLDDYNNGNTPCAEHRG